MATTFTIVAVFIPVAFMGGMVGPLLLRVRHHRGRGGARLAVRELHPRPDALVALGRPRHRAWLPRRTSSAARSRASTSGSTTCTCSYERLLDWALRHRWRCSAVAVARLPRQLPDPRRSSAATSCPTSTAASTRCRSRRRPGRPCARRGDARSRWCARLKTLPDVDYTYTTIGEAGITCRPVDRGRHLREAQADARQDLQPGAARGARRSSQTCPASPTASPRRARSARSRCRSACAGRRSDELDRISRELMQAMAKIHGVADIETSLEKSKPELRVEFDRDRASDLGLQRRRRWR